jgi:hypothetical protein
MKKYKPVITLNRNNRGCYILDTIKGCSICKRDKPLGCYDNCYAKNISYRYGFDFGTPQERGFEIDSEKVCFPGFEDSHHANSIIREIKNIDMPFVRIGEMGDPSENWLHTIGICETISAAKKPIVIITKHWNTIPEEIVSRISGIGLCINTSISAMDSPQEIDHRIGQYLRLKKYCKSVLRIVSCNFNTNSVEGSTRARIQDELFANDGIIDTVFRPSKSNRLVVENIINVEGVTFLKKKCLASVRSKNTYFGDCGNCPEMCGVNV